MSDKNSKNLLSLTLGAVGIVFGDIGTSPLYTLQECIGGPHGVAAAPDQILGVISLIFWSVTLVVSFKYVAFIMQADNRGEGGILALLALTPSALRNSRAGRVSLISLVAIVGAALLFGDGVITPAISVLSAVEGLEIASSAFAPFVVPLTCMVLLGLFAVQQRGTARISRFFAPIMLLWFTVIAGLGIYQILLNPTILSAISPVHAYHIFATNGLRAILIFGGVVLAITGGEALYADMGHFGKSPVRRAWLFVTYPALLCSYFGQGALLLSQPDVGPKPFFAMVPEGFWTYALVGLATSATAIASQAMISGVFSVTHQAVTLGYFPRLTVKHTSPDERGQIYLPLVNWTLAILSILLVLIFRKSHNLAAAYGLAVSGTMTMTTLLFYFVVRYRWKWSKIRSWSILLLFIAIDAPFLIANSFKFFDGGYVPVILGALVLVIMVNWRCGRSLLVEYFQSHSKPLTELMASLAAKQLMRSPGTAVVMTSTDQGVPQVLNRLIRRFHVVPQNLILLTVVADELPRVSAAERVSFEKLDHGFYRVQIRYGFVEIPDVPAALRQGIARENLPFKVDELFYVIGHESFVEQNSGRMGPISQAMYSFLSRNARNATDYFRIPYHQVVELGAQVDL